jgi:tetratricopeptide (TPR) repeat protein
MISVTRFFRLGVRFAAWATPHVKEWRRRRQLNPVEGQRHLDARNWTEAERHLTLALAERHHSAKQRIELLLGLEKAQRHQHKLAEAEQTAGMAIHAAAKARDHSARLLAMEALVDIQLEQHKYVEAEQTTKEILSVEEARPKPDRARLARCSHKLGTAFLKGGRKAEALEGFQRAALLAEQAFGPNHVETANSLAELGALHREHGDPAEAQRCIRRALDIHRVASGPDSPEATQDLHHLAAVLEESGDPAGAMGEYEKVLALWQRQVGGNREAAAETQLRLAILYLQVGRTSAARELLTHSIGVLERKGGDVLALALETLACAEDEIGRPHDARRWREKAAKLAAKVAV